MIGHRDQFVPRKTLVARDSLPGAPVGGDLVVVVGGAVLGRELERHQVEVMVGREIRVLAVELLVLGEEVGLDADLGLGEGEGFAPVVPLEHHLHQRLEEEPDFPLELTVGPERRLLPIPDLAAVDAGLVFPEGRDAGRELDRREDHLAAAGDHHLGHLVDEHLHQLLDLLVVHPLEVGRHECEEVVVALTAGKVRLGGTERLDRVEYRHLGPLRRAGHRGLRPVAVGHQAVVEEVTQVPILAKRASTKVFQVVDVEIAAEVVVRKLRRELQEILLLADLVRLLLVRGLGILLEIGVVVGLKPSPHIDEVRIKDRGSHPRADIPVGDQAALKKRHVDDLADQRTGKRLQTEHLDLLLNQPGDLLCRLLIRSLVAVEDLYESAFLDDLPDDPVPVPVEEVAPRSPDFRKSGDEVPK